MPDLRDQKWAFRSLKSGQPARSDEATTDKNESRHASIKKTNDSILLLLFGCFLSKKKKASQKCHYEMISLLDRRRRRVHLEDSFNAASLRRHTHAHEFHGDKSVDNTHTHTHTCYGDVPVDDVIVGGGAKGAGTKEEVASRLYNAQQPQGKKKEPLTKKKSEKSKKKRRTEFGFVFFLVVVVVIFFSSAIEHKTIREMEREREREIEREDKKNP